MGSASTKSSNRLKVIVATSTYPRWPDDEVPTFIQDQLVFFKKYYPCMEITILTPYHPGANSFEKTDYGDIFRFKYFYPARYQLLAYPIMPNLKKNKLLYLQIPFLFLFEFTALFGLVIKRKPDYIYSHWFIPQGIVGGLVGILTKTRHVYTSHSSDVLIAGRIPVIGPFIVRYITNRAHKVSVVSKRSYAKLRQYFSDEQWKKIEDKVRIIPMGINAALFKQTHASKTELKERFGYAGRNILLFIGRIVEKKGIKYILEALKDYIKTDLSVLMVIAGDGAATDELKELTRQMQLEEHVDFVGYTTGNKKQELFRICDAVLLPSIITDTGDAEGLPVVLMEAMAAGKICIATDVSGADDVIETGKNGFIIEQKSGKALLDALLLLHGLSQEEKDRMAGNAAETSKLFDWKNIVKQHVDHMFNQAKD
jgi:glycosyltransferase involved in cell wall biosynthesis